jgi:uncharacterized membrane protein
VVTGRVTRDRTRARAAESVSVTTARLEAFSDGVFAVAITLLVLDLKVPMPPLHDTTLGHRLGVQWPSYAAFVVSVLTIGIIWINHHAMISRLRAVDHTIMVLNLTLLLTVAALPFATSLMATYLKAGQGEHLAAAIYGGSFLAMSVVFAATNRHILFPKAQLLANQLDARARRLILNRGLTGLIPYAAATALAPVSAYATLVICAAVAVFYALPLSYGGQLGR